MTTPSRIMFAVVAVSAAAALAAIGLVVAHSPSHNNVGVALPYQTIPTDPSQRAAAASPVVSSLGGGGTTGTVAAVGGAPVSSSPAAQRPAQPAYSPPAAQPTPAPRSATQPATATPAPQPAPAPSNTQPLCSISVPSVQHPGETATVTVTTNRPGSQLVVRTWQASNMVTQIGRGTTDASGGWSGSYTTPSGPGRWNAGAWETSDGLNGYHCAVTYTVQ